MAVSKIMTIFAAFKKHRRETNEYSNMKKIVLLAFSLLFAIHAYSQDNDKLPEQSTAVSIDSLTVRLKRLQHDFDFLSCEYKLNEVKSELDELTHYIDISSNGILINLYHSQYDRALYAAYSKRYEAFCTNFDALKEKMETVKFSVAYDMMMLGFTDDEFIVLRAGLDSIEKSLNRADYSLSYHDAVLRSYQGKKYE